MDLMMGADQEMVEGYNESVLLITQFCNASAAQVCRGAHEAGTGVTSMSFSRDGYTLLSRGMDDTLKIWDVRRWVGGSRGY